MNKMIRRALLACAVVGMAIGCGGKKEEPAGKPGAKKGAAKAAKAAAKKVAPAARPKAPADVLVHGGTAGSVETALTQALALAAKVTPGLPTVDQLKPQFGAAMQGEYRLKDPNAFDIAKPIRFALLNPKTYRRPEITLVGVKSADAVAKALPETGKKEKDQGNAWSYQKFEGSSPVFVNFVEGYAVFTRHPEAFPKNKAFIESLAKAKLPNLGAVYVEVAHIMAAFSKDFDKGMAQAKAAMKQVAASGAAGGQTESMVAVIDWMAGAAKEVDHVQATAVLADDGAKLQIDIAAKAGSGLGKALAKLQAAGGFSLLSKVPADAPFFVAASLKPEAMADFTASVWSQFVVGPMFKGDTAKAKPYLDAMKDYFGGMDGQGVVAAHGKQSLELSALFGVTDAKKARAGQRKLADMTKEPSVAEYYKATGVSQEFKTNAYKIGDVEVDISTTKLLNLPPQAAAMGAMLGDLMTQHYAVSPKLAVVGYGAAAKTTLEGILSGSLKGGLDATPAAKRSVKHAATNAWMLMWVSPVELAKRIKLGGMNTFAPMLAGLPGDSGVAISVGGGGEVVQLVVDVPVATVKQGMGAFEKAKGAF